MKLIEVIINGKLHRMTERAMELLNLERKEPVKQIPQELQKLPPDFSILKIQKKEPEVVIVEVKKKEPEVVEVKKKEDVTVESTEKPKRKRHGRKVGTEK